MSYVIGAPCIDLNDQSCVEVCPVDCISSEAGVDRKSYIDPDECIDCGACVEACPNLAVFRSDQLPADSAPFAQADKLWYRDRSAARATVNAAVPPG